MARVVASEKKSIDVEPVSQSVSQSRKKAPKGTVVIQVFKERLRLWWSYLGKRYYLYIGLPDSKTNRIAAEQRARQIEGDIATNNFDSTLRKYKPQSRIGFEFLDLWKKFVAHKRKSVTARTITTTFDPVLVKVKEYGSIKTRSDAEQFAIWLQTQVSASWAKRMITMLNACFKWGIEQSLTTENPFEGLTRNIKVPPKQASKPFTSEEMGAIVLGFRSDRYYSHYADYVEFLFGTGCRTGEAIGLRWKHLSDDCSIVWIGESLSRGVRKSTKTNRARTVALTPKLQAMLLARRPANPDPDGLVFTSPQGGAIDDHNFRNRAWKTVLTRLEIDYRKPYTTRSTLISHALDLGMNPVMIAQLTGHDVQVLYQNYAGNVNSRPRLPEL